jgi:hypothetical protein
MPTQSHCYNKDSAPVLIALLFEALLSKNIKTKTESTQTQAEAAQKQNPSFKQQIFKAFKVYRCMYLQYFQRI